MLLVLGMGYAFILLRLARVDTPTAFFAALRQKLHSETDAEHRLNERSDDPVKIVRAQVVHRRRRLADRRLVRRDGGLKLASGWTVRERAVRRLIDLLGREQHGGLHRGRA